MLSRDFHYVGLFREGRLSHLPEKKRSYGQHLHVCSSPVRHHPRLEQGCCYLHSVAGSIRPSIDEGKGKTKAGYVPRRRVEEKHFEPTDGYCLVFGPGTRWKK
ncbi:hypothetical protein R1flu_023250 [Riccia fluitans]|uniref:Uncharacterized protein n=1 Tax=Riccia fluitans TaxID=41844 RepID=A0ABD1XRI2_9MARC